MKLLLIEHTKKLIEHGRATSAAQLEGLDEPDHMPVVKLFTPDANCTWLISELDPDDHDLAFGLCDLGFGCPELGSVRISEIESVRGALGLPAERDRHFRPERSLSAYADLARKNGRIDQLLCLDMEPSKNTARKLFAAGIDSAVSEAVALRTELRGRPVRDIHDVETMAGLDRMARDKLQLPGLIADGLVAEALLAGKRSIDSTSLSIEAGKAIAGDNDAAGLLRRRATNGLKTDLATGKPIRKPFHWPLEFPEVFGREQKGFDAFIGNPPFVGGQMLQSTFGFIYQSYLVEFATLNKKSSVDLVVFFFLRAYALLGSKGYLGLIGRRSIAEGKNKEAGLEQILESGAAIYTSQTNVQWPGKASVVVHLINISKGPWLGAATLNNGCVSSINANLTDIDFSGVQRLEQNKGYMFQGSILNGEGFKISGSEADRLIEEGCEDIVFPFIGGSDVNSNPEPLAGTWVINFWDWSFEEARGYPAAFGMIEDRVKPERTRKKPDGEYKLRKPLPQKWWQHGEKRPALYNALGRGHLFRRQAEGGTAHIQPPRRVIVVSRGATTYPAFTFCDNSFVFSEKLYVLTLDNSSVLAVLVSDIHLVWAHEHGHRGVVWTALKPKFGNDYVTPRAEQVLEYLESLTGEPQRLAEEYIRKAPKQIVTSYRQDIERTLGWTPLTDE